VAYVCNACKELAHPLFECHTPCHVLTCCTYSKGVCTARHMRHWRATGFHEVVSTIPGCLFRTTAWFNFNASQMFTNEASKSYLQHQLTQSQ
jgi:hypothetical protein